MSFAKVRGRTCKHLGAQVGKTRLKFGELPPAGWRASGSGSQSLLRQRERVGFALAGSFSYPRRLLLLCLFDLLVGDASYYHTNNRPDDDSHSTTCSNCTLLENRIGQSVNYSIMNSL